MLLHAAPPCCSPSPPIGVNASHTMLQSRAVVALEGKTLVVHDLSFVRRRSDRATTGRNLVRQARQRENELGKVGIDSTRGSAPPATETRRRANEEQRRAAAARGTVGQTSGGRAADEAGDATQPEPTTSGRRDARERRVFVCGPLRQRDLGYRRENDGTIVEVIQQYLKRGLITTRWSTVSMKTFAVVFVAVLAGYLLWRRSNHISIFAQLTLTG